MTSRDTQPAGSPSREASPVPRPNARTSCDLCKRMKIKCERQGETCLHCIDRGAQCETTLVERKKRQVTRVDPGSIAEMESRIKRLEAVIVAAGLNGQPKPEPESAAKTSEGPAPNMSNMSDRLSQLVVHEDDGTVNYLGPSSSFSIFSPQGLQWISARTGNNDLPGFIKGLTKAHKASLLTGKIDLWTPCPESKRAPLPPKQLADHWIDCFFTTFNAMLPLYDRNLFDKFYEKQYTDDPPTGSDWVASLNVILSIGGMISEIHSEVEGRGPGNQNAFPMDFSPSSSAPYAGYFLNAASCFLDLTFREPSLMSVQAMCGLAFLQQLSLEPQPSNVLIQTAGRMAYSIGLHKKLDDFGLSEVEINQRKNIFWVVYVLDRATSLRLGVPGVMNDDDIGIDLPMEVQGFAVNAPEPRIYDIFRSHVLLAMLESRIYTELYTVKAHRKSAYDRLRTVGHLDKELQDWKMSIPIEIRPGEVIRCSQEQFPPVFLMHFEFYNCVSTIHRVSAHHRGPWTKEDSSQIAAVHNPQLNPRVYSSESICLGAARSTIKLLEYIEVIDEIRLDKIIWTEIYYPLSAFLLLFANIVHNPEDPCAASDLQLMDLVISVLSPIVDHVQPDNSTVTLRLCLKLRNVAKEFAESASTSQSTKMKREHDSDLPKDVTSPSMTFTPVSTHVPVPTYEPVAPQTPMNRNMGFNAYNPQSPSFHTQQYPQQYSQQYPVPYPQQYSQMPFDAFGNPLPIPSQHPVPLDNSGFPTLGFDPLMFSENFEWDLARMWDQECSPASHNAE